MARALFVLLTLATSILVTQAQVPCLTKLKFQLALGSYLIVSFTPQIDFSFTFNPIIFID